MESHRVNSMTADFISPSKNGAGGSKFLQFPHCGILITFRARGSSNTKLQFIYLLNATVSCLIEFCNFLKSFHTLLDRWQRSRGALLTQAIQDGVSIESVRDNWSDIGKDFENPLYLLVHKISRLLYYTPFGVVRTLYVF